MTRELLPCPFCGSDKHTIECAPDELHANADHQPWAHAVFCGMCSAAGPDAKTDTEAISSWNRRAALSEPEGRAALKRFRHDYEEMVEDPEGPYVLYKGDSQ